MQISVKSDVKAAMRELDDLRKNQIPKAAARALNRTRDQAQTVAVKEIAKETGMKQKDVRDAMSKVNAVWTKLTASLIASGRALNVIRFGARQTSTGVSANPWGKRRVFPHTFIGNQGRTVFVRQGKERLPIRPVYGPSIPREMERDRVSRAIKAMINERWHTNFEHEIQFYTNKSSGPPTNS